MKNNQKKSNDKNLITNDPVLNKKYQYIQTLGEGCFGKVIKVLSRSSKEHRALKIEKTRQQKTKMVLKNQIKIMVKLQGKKGVPKVYDYGNWKDGTFLQMEILEHDLNFEKDYTNQQIQQLAAQLLKVLNSIHSVNVIHQDIKPQNIMVSKGQYYIVDFGLSHLFSANNQVTIKGFIGTPRYASIRAHGHFQQSKRDDLQSLFYNLAYLYYRKLPWSKLNVTTQKKLQQIKLLKIQYKDTLFNDMPVSFQKAFNYINSLNAYEQPNYNLLIGMFKKYKTLIIQPNNQNSKEQRSKVKRSTVGNTNLLSIPIARYGSGKQQFRKIQERFQKSRQKSQFGLIKRTSRRSLSSLSGSDIIHSQLFSIAANEDFNIEDFNVDDQKQKDLVVGNRNSKRSIILKNPFV